MPSCQFSTFRFYFGSPRPRPRDKTTAQRGPSKPPLGQSQENVLCFLLEAVSRTATGSSPARPRASRPPFAVSLLLAVNPHRSACAFTGVLHRGPLAAKKKQKVATSYLTRRKRLKGACRTLEGL